MKRKLNIETKLVHGASGYDKTTGAVSIPIYQSATFRHPALDETTGYDYSRLFKTGDHLIISDDLYGGVYRLFEEIYSNYGIETTYVDITDINSVNESIKINTKAILFETPTNPMLKIADIEHLSMLAKAHNILTIVDNTLLTPYLQKPLDLGADIALYSATKFLAGHNDTLSGLVTTNSDDIAEKLKLIQKSEGAVLAPFDSWLVLRGIKTLSVRMDRQQDNAIKIAEFLSQHPAVEKVNFTGIGAVLSFSAKSAKEVEKVLKNVSLIYFAESLGGCETLITYPSVQTHNAIPEEIRNRLGVDDKLLRLSVGIENANDIIADLKQALESEPV